MTNLGEMSGWQGLSVERTEREEIFHSLLFLFSLLSSIFSLLSSLFSLLSSLFPLPSSLFSSLFSLLRVSLGEEIAS